MIEPKDMLGQDIWVGNYVAWYKEHGLMIAEVAEIRYLRRAHSSSVFSRCDDPRDSESYNILLQPIAGTAHVERQDYNFVTKSFEPRERAKPVTVPKNKVGDVLRLENAFIHDKYARRG